MKRLLLLLFVSMLCLADENVRVDRDDGTMSPDVPYDLPASSTMNGVAISTGGGGSSGDVVGPASSTDDYVALFNGTSGTLLKSVSVSIDASSNLSGVGNIALSGKVDGVDIANLALGFNMIVANYLTKSGTPVDGQVGIWTSATNMEGDSGLSWDGSILTIVAGGRITLGSDQVLLESAGQIALNNVNSLGAVTEQSIEDAIDTLNNLSVAGQLGAVGTITVGVWQGDAIADAYVAGAVGWDSKQDGDADLDDLADGSLTGSKVSVADDDGATLGVAAFDNTNFDATAGVVTIASVAGIAGADEDDVTLADVQTATTSDFHNIGGTDDDVPDAGDFGAATDLDSNGALNAGSVDADELASTAATPGTYQLGLGGSFTVDADGRLTASAASGSYHTMFISAAAMAPRATDGPEFASEEYTGSDVQVDTLLFDGSTDEAATVQIALPDAWDLGTLKFKYYWAGSTSMAGSDTIQFEIAARALQDDTAIDAAFTGAIGTNDDLLAIDDVHISAASAAVTVSNSPALGNLILIQIKRDVSVEEVPEEVKLIGLAVQWREKTTVTAGW